MWLVFTFLGALFANTEITQMQLTTTRQHQEQGLQHVLGFRKHRNHSVLTPLLVVWTELSDVLPALKIGWIHAILEAAVVPRKYHLAVQITIPVS